ILPQLEIHLTVPGIDGDDSRSAALEQTVSKPSGGRAHVKARSSFYIDAPVVQSALQLQSAAAHVLEIFSEQTNCGRFIDLYAGLLDLLFVDKHIAGENHGLRSLA